MKRKFDPAQPELMDRPQPVSRELEDDLRNLRQLNSWFGSYALVRRFLCRWITRGASLRVLDLATGSGDIPRLVVNFARATGATVHVTAVDQQEATLAIARGLSATYTEIEYVQGDVLSFGGGDEGYDIVMCSLALHHFGEEDAVKLLERARALSRGDVLVADLRRGMLASAGVYLLTALVFREPMTQTDGRLSAARAFSFAEFDALARRAGWQDFGHRKFRFARQAVWLEAKVG